MYTLHQETADGSLHSEFYRTPRKRQALRCAAKCAKGTHIDVVQIVVCDKNGSTIKTYPVSSAT